MADTNTQKKLFTRWCNFYLAKRGHTINDLITDFQDGLLLAALVGEITGKEPPRLKAAKLRVQRIQNVGLVLQFIAGLGVKMVNIEAEDVVNGKEKIILSITWTLIQRYQLRQHDTKVKGANVKDRLLYWVRKQLEDGTVQVRDLNDDWQDGVAFCTLINKLKPSLINLSEIKPEDRAKNLELAFSLAEKHLNVPRLLDVEDILQKPDEQGIITYLSFFAQDIESIEPPPNFLASLNVVPAPAPAPAKKPKAAIKISIPKSTGLRDSGPLSPGSPKTPTTPVEKKAEVKVTTPKKSAELKKIVTPPPKQPDDIEIFNGVVNLKAIVDKAGALTFSPFETVTRNDRWYIRLQIEDAPFSSRESHPPSKVVVKRDGSRVEELVEKVEGGIEHSFILQSGPTSPFSMKLGIKMEGITKVTHHDANLCFWSGDSPVFAYQNLVIKDATGHQLKSNMFWEAKGSHIVLDVLEAPKYPVLIDPLATTPKGPLSFSLSGYPKAEAGAESTSGNESDSEGTDSDSESNSNSPAGDKKIRGSGVLGAAKKTKQVQKPKKSGTSEAPKAHSLSVQFPALKLPSSWLGLLYGNASAKQPLPQTESSIHIICAV